MLVDAGVVGGAGEERCEDGHGFVFLAEGGVVGLVVGEQGESVEGAGVGVGRVFGVEGVHGGGVGGDACGVVELAGPVEGGERGEVVMLAWRGLEGLGLFDFGPAVLHGFGVGAIPDLVEAAHGEAPVGDGAGWVSLGEALELGLGFLVPEVVEEGDAAVDGGLRGGAAGVGEGDGAEALLRCSLHLLSRLCDERQNGREQEQERKGFHGAHYRFMRERQSREQGLTSPGAFAIRSRI